MAHFTLFIPNRLTDWTIEWLRERTKHIDIFLFSAHLSVVFYFRCSVYWWNAVLDFNVLKYKY